jgi:6-phospho-3-hexuloisomerase
MSRFKELVQAVIEENRTSLLDMEDSEVQRLVDEIAEAKKVQVFGMGRMKCAVRAFVMRLMHGSPTSP